MDQFSEEGEDLEFEMFVGPLSEENIIAFAQILGMHPIRDKELLWFAEDS